MNDYVELSTDCVGIYLLLFDDAVIYVGQSRNVYTRIGQHFGTIAFNRILFRPCTIDQLDDLEAKAITEFQPTLNKRLPMPKSAIKVDLRKLGFPFRKYWEQDDNRRITDL